MSASDTGEGLESSNPELPTNQRERNEEWLRREMGDVRLALARLEMSLDDALSGSGL